MLLLAALLLVPGLGAAQTAPAPVFETPPELPERIPLFPLQDVMLFPHISRPFHIFEPRYREMVADALRGDRIIGMVLLEPGHEDEYEGNPPIRSVGTAGIIEDVEMFPDGRYNIMLRGIAKFQVAEEDQSLVYRQGQVEALPEAVDDRVRDGLAARRPEIEAAFAARVPDASPPPSNLTDVDFVNGLAQFLSLDPLDRQDLLEQEDPLARAEALLDLMRREAAADGR